MTLPLTTALGRRPGRPKKFSGPSRAVTVTLPESAFDILRTVDADVSRAIVRLAARARPAARRPPAQLAVYGRHAVITIRPTRTLEERAGVQLIPLPDGRALISFDQPRTIEELELLLYDALDDRRLTVEDRQIFDGIAKILTEARRSRNVALLRRSIIVLEMSHAAPRLSAGSRREE